MCKRVPVFNRQNTGYREVCCYISAGLKSLVLLNYVVALSGATVVQVGLYAKYHIKTLVQHEILLRVKTCESPPLVTELSVIPTPASSVPV